MLIDTHSHIYSDDYNGDTDKIMQRALDADVQKILLPNIDSSSIKRMLDLTARYKKNCFPMMGIHPTSVNNDYKQELEVFDYWIKKEKFYAIGEIGIDLYWDNSYKHEQKLVFEHQLNYAEKMQLPVSIHTRDSFEFTFDILTKSYYKKIRGAFHCFTGTIEQAKAAIDAGFKIGVGGIVTFKNSGISQMIAQLQPSDLLLETDSPYLTPSPYRGKRNESSYLTFIAEKVAEIFDMPVDEIAKITSKNAEELFGI